MQLTTELLGYATCIVLPFSGILRSSTLKSPNDRMMLRGKRCFAENLSCSIDVLVSSKTLYISGQIAAFFRGRRRLCMHPKPSNTVYTPNPPPCTQQYCVVLLPTDRARCSPLNTEPQGTVPLEAHEAMVESIAGDFSRREEALRAQLDQRDKSFRRASSDIGSMSNSLKRLKRDVASLRTALGRYRVPPRVICVRAVVAASGARECSLSLAREKCPPTRT